MKYNICKAEYDDLEEILTLQKFSYEENGRRYNNFNIPPLTQTLDDIREEFKKQIFLKAENEKGKII
nr:GNAT family N-acetyltransferase [Spirochaetota bacterium]